MFISFLKILTILCLQTFSAFLYRHTDLPHCCNLPFGGRATRDSRDACSTKGICAESPPTFIWGKRRKNRKRRDLRTFKWKVRELFLRAGKVLAPHASVTRDGSLYQVCKYDFNLFHVPFYVFMSFCAFCIFYLFVVDKGVSLAPTYSSIVVRKYDLRSSSRIKRWLSCFYLFCKIYCDQTKSRLRSWTI